MFYGATNNRVLSFGKYVCWRVSLLSASSACSPIDFPVLFFTIYPAPVVTPDWIIEAVLNPEAAGPIKAKGAIKQPDKVTPTATIKSNLLIIESPFFYKSLYFLRNKKKEQIYQLSTTLSCNYFSKLCDLFAIMGKFL